MSVTLGALQGFHRNAGVYVTGIHTTCGVNNVMYYAVYVVATCVDVSGV